jgi:hypothetical protein
VNALSLAAYDDALDLELVSPPSAQQLAVVHAQEDASRPPATRFLALAHDGTVAREFGDISDALAWQRVTVRVHFVIADDGRLLAIPAVAGAMQAAEEAVAAWREAQIPEEARSGVRMVGR